MLEVMQVTNFSARHVEHESGLGSFAGGGVGVGAVVVDAQRSEAGHQLDQVKPAVLEAPANMLGGDIVAAAEDASLDSFDVQFWTGKADVPDMGLDALRRGLCEQARNRVGAQRGFKSEVFALGDRLFQQLHALVPGGAIEVCLSQIRVSRDQRAGSFVGIKVVGSGCAKGRAADAALAGAIDARKNVDA